MITLGSSAATSLSCLMDIQQNVKFEKTGLNKLGGNYSYYKLSDLLGGSKAKLKEYVCVVLFSTKNTECRGGFEKLQGAKDVAPKDKLVTHAYTEVVARIQNVNDINDFVEVTAFGYKTDQTADKALGAYTVGARYALMQMFNVEGDIDPDSDEDDVRGNDIMASIFQPKQAPPKATATPQVSSATDDLLKSLGA